MAAFHHRRDNALHYPLGCDGSSFPTVQHPEYVLLWMRCEAALKVERATYILAGNGDEERGY